MNLDPLSVLVGACVGIVVMLVFFLIFLWLGRITTVIVNVNKEASLEIIKAKE